VQSEWKIRIVLRELIGSEIDFSGFVRKGMYGNGKRLARQIGKRLGERFFHGFRGNRFEEGWLKREHWENLLSLGCGFYGTDGVGISETCRVNGWDTPSLFHDPQRVQPGAYLLRGAGMVSDRKPLPVSVRSGRTD
jgi:hypothetical protein